MIKSYLKVALRSFSRQKAYTLINVVGLGLGMACCVVLFLFIQHERSFDRFHENADRIHRVLLRSEYEGSVKVHPKVAAPLAPTWLQEFPGIERAVRFGKNTYLVKYQDKRFYERVFFADPAVFEVFSFPLVEGDPKSALSDPESLLISQSMRDKYFGLDDPLGKTLALNDSLYRISGVFRDISKNSHLRFDFLGSFARYERAYAGKWGVSNFATYVLVREDFSFADYDRRMPELVEKFRGRETRFTYGVTYPLEPLTRIYLHSRADWDMGPAGNVQHLYIFSAVALFILLIACFNTINLSTARALTRAREVGMRKVVGAGRRHVAFQFLGESFLLTAVSLLLSVLLVEMILPVFNSLSGKLLTMDLFGNLSLSAFLLSVLLLVGFFSGSVMSLYVSGFPPTQIMKGAILGGARVPLFRKFVITGQFAISIIFIAATLIIFHQLNYMRTKKLGYNREHVVSVPIFDKEVFENLDVLKTELLSSPDILSVSAASFSPGRVIWYQNFRYEGMPEDMNPMIRWIATDYDFLETLDLKLASGRGFSPDFSTDLEGAYILNEAAVRSIGWEEPLGKRMKVAEEGTVVGILEDFHFQSLHHPIEPLALCIWPQGYENFLVRFRAGRTPQALAHMQSAWQDFSPGQAFTYTFLDEAYDNLYSSEIRLSRVFGYVAGISLFVACLGLLGLASFSIERRTKEIGIRKVLGASVPGIAALFAGEFIRWVLVANVVAWPVVLWAMRAWMGNFAYRARLGLPIFLLSGALALVIALMTVGYQAVKAAVADPIDSLRYE